jgi:hypothetical protein
VIERRGNVVGYRYGAHLDRLVGRSNTGPSITGHVIGRS